MPTKFSFCDGEVSVDLKRLPSGALPLAVVRQIAEGECADQFVAFYDARDGRIEAGGKVSFGPIEFFNEIVDLLHTFNDFVASGQEAEFLKDNKKVLSVE